MSITPQQHSILMAYLGGQNGYQIAQSMGLSPQAIYKHLRNPVVKAAMAERLKEVDMQIVDFKVTAINGAMGALDKLINLSQHAADEHVQRAASKDVIEIAGLMPQKRVLLQGDILNGIDKDTAAFYDEVTAELGKIVDDIEYTSAPLTQP